MIDSDSAVQVKYYFLSLSVIEKHSYKISVIIIIHVWGPITLYYTNDGSG